MVIQNTVRTKALTTAIIRSERVVMDVVLVHLAVCFIGSVAIGATGTLVG